MTDIQNVTSHLFERTPPQEYIDQLTQCIKTPSQEEKEGGLSVLIFRLGKNWLALPTVFFKEVTQRRPVHHIPFRSNEIILGLVNLNGELQIYVALHKLLEIETPFLPETNSFTYQHNRMIAISKDEDLWVFPVEEIKGIFNWNISSLEKISQTMSKETSCYSKGVMKVDQLFVDLLDEELLFSDLKRGIQ